MLGRTLKRYINTASLLNTIITKLTFHVFFCSAVFSSLSRLNDGGGSVKKETFLKLLYGWNQRILDAVVQTQVAKLTIHNPEKAE